MGPMSVQLLGWLFGALAAGRRSAIAFLGEECGQAMVEYSTITFALLIGAGAAGFAMKWPEFGNQSLAQALYQALQTYVNSVNFSLSLAAT